MDWLDRKLLRGDIIRATDSEVVLTLQDWLRTSLLRFFALMLGVVALGSILDAYNRSDYFSEAVGGYFEGLCVLTLTVAFWQVGDRTQTIQFNQPVGHLTVLISNWWSILIPGGPRFIRRSFQRPLPKGQATVLNWFIPVTNAGRIDPHTVRVTQTRENRYTVFCPVDDEGKGYALWSTPDKDACDEIVRRINRAIQECCQTKE